MPKLPAPLRKKLIALVLAGAGTFTIATHYTGYWEGKENSTYIDPTGTPTICYGHTGPDVKPGMTLTDEECLELLEKDMKWAFAAIDRRVQVPLTRGQTVALASWIFWAGEGRKDYSVHRITLDDAIADGLYRRICYVTGREWSPESEQKWRDDLYKNAPTREDADEEYGCIPKKSGGAYIPHALIEMAMIRDIPILTFEAPDDFISRAAWLRESEVLTWCEEHLKPLLEALNPRSRFSFGEDFARTGDLSCFVLLEITESLAKREVFRVELRNLPYAQQEQVMMYILTRVPALVGAAFDATGNGGYLAEAALLAFGPDIIDCVMLSPKWYGEWMPKLKAEFEDQNILVARHQTTLDDLRHVKVVNGIPQIDKGRTKDQNATAVNARRHGDFAVALCMANRASYMEGFILDESACQALPERSRAMEGGYRDDDEAYHEFDRGCW